MPCALSFPSQFSGLRFIHNSIFSFPPTLCSDWNLCLALWLLLMFTMYLARPECILSRSLFYSSTSKCILKINHYFILWYYKRLGLVPSLSSWDVELLSCFPIKVVAGKCNAWLHLTPQYGLALGDGSRKISTPGCGPPVPPDLLFYSTQEGHPSWFPLVPSD